MLASSPHFTSDFFSIDPSISSQDHALYLIEIFSSLLSLPYTALYVIVYQEVMVLLQTQDDRYILKCHGVDKQQPTHSPFLKMDSLLIRPVATGMHLIPSLLSYTEI